MRRFLVLALAAVAAFGMLAPPVFAQQAAAPPAPKVTITGLYDFVTSLQHNQENLDLADAGRHDRGFYTRQRFVPTFTGEVGKTKAVWAVEIDLLNGSNSPGQGDTGGTTNAFDLDTDVANSRACTSPSNGPASSVGAAASGCSGLIETKWLYLETPLTGAGSILPFIPVPTTMKVGGFAAGNIHNYKTATVLAGDIPGVNLSTTWAPNITTHLTWVQIGEGDSFLRTSTFKSTDGANEDGAVLASVDTELIKGLKIKPTYAYAFWRRGTSGGTFGNEAKDGFNPQTAVRWMDRHYLGLDARWTVGPFYVEPTVFWEKGAFRQYAGVPGSGAPFGAQGIEAWLFDLSGGFRTGPLKIEARGTWVPGMEAQHKVASGSEINYFQNIHSAGVWYTGWAEMWAQGLEANMVILGGADGLARSRGPSYDKYGYRLLAVAADYSLTPALTLKGLINVSWTDQEVDTNGALTTNGITAQNRGDERYLGTEASVGLTWRFAPNIALDLNGAYLWAGDALGHRDVTLGNANVVRDPSDVYRLVTRLRYTF